MIPAIIRKELLRLTPRANAIERNKQIEMESAAIIGFTSAIAACGAFFIPKSYGTPIAMTGGVKPAFWGFRIFCSSCIGTNNPAKGCLQHALQQAAASI